MAGVFIIPIIIVSIIGLSSYLIYKTILFDYLSKRSINQTLKKYEIQKSTYQIIKEYYEKLEKPKSNSEILKLEKIYRQKEPDKFLEMYDLIRE